MAFPHRDLQRYSLPLISHALGERIARGFERTDRRAGVRLPLPMCPVEDNQVRGYSEPVRVSWDLPLGSRQDPLTSLALSLL